MRTIHVSPHDMSWLYDRCKCCWRRKVDGIKMGEDKIPGVFKAIDGGMKTGITLELLRHHGIPAMKFVEKERVKSASLVCDDVELVVAGYLDKLVLLDDDTYGIVDFKTSAPKNDNFTKYWRQLSGYQYAVEFPSEGEAREVSRLDLVVFNPARGRFMFDKNLEDAAQTGKIERIEVEHNRPRFHKLLEEMARVAASAVPPAPSTWCETCKAIDAAVSADKARMVAA